jgi:hypothetical protein
MKLPPAVRQRFREHGRQGGRKRAASLSPESRRSIARLAAIRRWIQRRFGAPTFASLGLPGGEAIDSGLIALTAGRESVESLMVSLAAPRLRREGVPLPQTVLDRADIRLYRRLERTDGELAHTRYLACLRLLKSFADACSGVRIM